MKTIGTALRKKSPKSAPAGAMAQPAQELGIPVGERRRYRQFATMYTNTELIALYKRCRIKKFALTTTHFRVLIGVKEKSIRATLAQKAIKERLSVSALQRLAREKTKKKKRKPRSQPSGRKPEVLKLLEQGEKKRFRERLLLIMTKWRGLLEHLLKPDEKGKTNKAINRRIAKALKQLQTSMEEVEKVCKSIRSK